MWIKFAVFCILFAPAIKSKAINEEPQCKDEGDQFCIDCNKAVKCFYTSAQRLYPKVSQCDLEGMTCHDGDCTPKDNHSCDESVANYQFSCGQEGRFPDAYDCFQYHDCRKSLRFRTTKCKKEKSYNVSLGECANRLVGGGCRQGEMLPICRRLGQSGVAFGNNTMFYLCAPERTDQGEFLMPKLYLCPKGEIFENEKCVASN